MAMTEEARRLRAYLPRFEEAYDKFHKREYVSPDPLETLYRYESPADREVVGLAVSSIAYGRVAQILKNAGKLLDIMGPSPRDFLLETPTGAFDGLLAGFKHRFTTGSEMAALLTGMARVIRDYGSLEALFAEGLEGGGGIIEASDHFSGRIRQFGGVEKSYLLPSPRDGSACKRFFLFLKWMVRSDDVDPGGWVAPSPDGLVFPMDVHMFRVCSALGLTKRKGANLRTALEVTELFRGFLPEDPVRYDFVLTRFGIRSELDEDDFVDECLEVDDAQRGERK